MGRDLLADLGAVGEGADGLLRGGGADALLFEDVTTEGTELLEGGEGDAGVGVVGVFEDFGDVPLDRPVVLFHRTAEAVKVVEGDHHVRIVEFRRAQSFRYRGRAEGRWKPVELRSVQSFREQGT